MAVTHERVIFDKPIAARHHLRIIAIVDRKDWKVATELCGPSVSGLTVSIKDVLCPPTSPVPRRSLSKTFVVSDPRDKPSPRITSPTARPNAATLPYKLSIAAIRTDRRTYHQEGVGCWLFSGELKQGRYMHFRADAFLDRLREECDDGPYFFDIVVRVISKRSRRIENGICESGVLDIGTNLYENVSKEILALYSDFFNTFFYGGFAESVNSGACKMQPLIGEKQQDFATAMNLLLNFVHTKSLSLITPLNAHLLIEIAERYQFSKSIEKRIDAHLTLYIPTTEDKQMLDEVVILTETYDLPLTRNCIIQQYKTSQELGELFDRQKDRLSPDVLVRVFQSYRTAVQNAFYLRTCHIFFEFAAGRVIVQLNRVALPKTIAKVIDELSGSARFYWDHKHRLVSAEPVNHFYCGEHAEKNTVPEGSWAFILRFMKDNCVRLMLTKSRPPESHQPIYLGFVVKGEQYLTSASPHHSSCYASGVHYLNETTVSI